MDELQRTLSPVDGSVVVERVLARPAALDRALIAGQRAFQEWRQTPLDTRRKLLTAFVDAVTAEADTYAAEITTQMGRPIRYAGGELRGFAERGHAMIAMSPDALADIVPPARDGFRRYIRREPLGLVLVLAPWNYPWLTAVNAVVPALLAGNTVLLKHSDQTPLVAERMVEAGRAAGLPAGVFECIHMSHALTADAVRDGRVAHVCFTGSVEGGRAVHRAAAGTFKTVGLELGGKDPAYIRADAALDATLDGVVDGAFFNSGQSCCGIERVFVHRDLYDAAVAGIVARVQQYVLGNPNDAATTLGPVVRVRNAELIQRQVDAAVAAGARALIGSDAFAPLGPAYLAPQVLVDVDPRMEVQREETFGPVVTVSPVDSDADAVARMNDSHYGLTASIWTADVDAAEAIGQQLDTGTVFANRCDYLDPELAWVGVKNSGRGATLSRVGFETLTRPKSFHLRMP